MKIKVNSLPSTNDFFSEKAHDHLDPIVNFLIKHGNKPFYQSIFYRDKDGWVCILRKHINFKLLKDNFEFPPTIHLNEKTDSIFCEKTWIEIKGNIN